MNRFAKFAIVAVMSITAAVAQIRLMDHSGNGPSQNNDPATMIANRVAFLKALLTLTDAQVTQATKIYTDQLAAETTLRASLDTARTSLTAAVKSNSTATIASLSSEIGTLNGKMTLADATADAAFYALLTADQKTKFDALNGQDGGGRGPGGPGGPGGPR